MCSFPTNWKKKLGFNEAHGFYINTPFSNSQGFKLDLKSTQQRASIATSSRPGGGGVGRTAGGSSCAQDSTGTAPNGPAAKAPLHRDFLMLSLSPMTGVSSGEFGERDKEFSIRELLGV